MKMDKAKVENCIAKTRAFYDTKAVGCALLKVKNIATLPSPALSLTDYTFPDDVYKYLDARCARRSMVHWARASRYLYTSSGNV